MKQLFVLNTYISHQPPSHGRSQPPRVVIIHFPIEGCWHKALRDSVRLSDCISQKLKGKSVG